MPPRPPFFNAVVLAASFAVPVLGQPASPAPSSTPDVVVTAPKDPKVVKTFPVDGSSLPGGTVILKITFDQPMVPAAWSYTPVPGKAFPDCLARPRLLNDHRTFALLCSLSINSEFAIGVNAAPDFVSTAGRSPSSFQLRFTTTGDTTNNLHDALVEAGLTDADDPIMGTRPSDGEIRQAPPTAASEPAGP